MRKVIMLASNRTRSRLWVTGIATLYLAVGGTGAIGAMNGDVKDDERVVFFPSYAFQDEDGTSWVAEIHGWVFEPEHDSKKREILMGLLRRALGLEAEAAESVLFKERAWPFLVDNERGKRIRIRCGERGFVLEETGPNGHCRTTIRLPVVDQEQVRPGDQGKRRWYAFQAVLPKDDRRKFGGWIELIAPVGLSVVSDIDDTIKISNVGDKRELLANTFLRDYKAVPGMAQLYLQWAAQGASFHYVSASPWQLYESKSDFLANAGFPLGSYHMKTFRWKDSSFFDLFSSPLELKLETIRSIIEKFPRRRFILVGDSGEKDPEAYGELARQYPDQIIRIYIRRVSEQSGDPIRMKSAFTGVPAERWQLFRDPFEINSIIKP